MIYIYNFDKSIPDKWRVGSIHCMPFDLKHGLHKSKEELEQTGAFVDALDSPQHIPGKAGVLFYKPSTNTVFYEYIDETPVIDEITEIKYRQELMQQALDELILGGAL